MKRIPVELVNAYTDYNSSSLTLVERSDGKITRRVVPADYSLFVKQESITRELGQAIREYKDVTGVIESGDYYKIKFSDRDSRRWFVTNLPKKGIETFDGDVTPIRRYIVDTGRKPATPRACYLDIETDSRIRFSQKEKMRILCWVVVDAETGRKYRGLLDEDSDKDERRVLVELFKVLDHYDQVRAWNGDRFDFPVIKARASLQDIKIEFRRWLWLDYCELFRRMNMMGAESGDEKANYKLETIAQAVLGRGKSNYDSSKTWEGWLRDKQELLDYCSVDTQLMRDIETKTGYIALFQVLCDVCSVFPDSYGINPSVQVEGFLMSIAKDRGYKFVTRVDRKKTVGDEYEGAFVMHPIKYGLIKNVHVCDFKSLYPSIIITWNISPETKVAPNTPGACRTPKGTWFSTEQMGILPFAVNELIRLRKFWQQEEAKHPPNTPEWFDAHRRSTAYKIAANSFYGVIGSPMSRFFDRDVAESVTLAGQWLIKRVITEAEERGMQALMGDTDSSFVTGAVRQEFADFIFTYCNKELIPKMLADCGCKENRISLDFDKSFERLIIPVNDKGEPISKKYAGRLAHSKGTEASDDTEPEIKGLEYKRGDAIKLARNYQKQVVDLLCKKRCEDPVQIAELVQGFKDHILSNPLDITDILISKALDKDIDAYGTKIKIGGGVAAQPPHVEVAKILRDRGRDVSEGTKIEYFVVDGSTSPKKFAPAEDWTGEFDRYEIWDNKVWPTIRRLVAAAFDTYDWTQFDKSRPDKPRKRKPVSVNQTDLLDWLSKKQGPAV